MVLRENSSTSLTDASYSGTLPLGGSSSKRRQKKGNKRRFAKTNKQISISDEGGVLKGSFQGDTFENLQVSNDGGVLNAYATDDLVVMPQEQEMLSQDKQVRPRISVFQRPRKVNEPKQKNI